MTERRRRGFSVVELLTVLGVMGLLTGLTLPAVQQARAAAARAACQNTLKQLGLALHNYEAAHGRLPPAPAKPFPAPDPNALLGWMALILPHVGQVGLYAESERACRADQNPTRNPPHVGFATPVSAFVCPLDGRLQRSLTDRYGTTAAFASYVAVSGAMGPIPGQALPGAMGEQPGVRLGDITDGTSTTLLAGERPPPDSLQAGWWYPVYAGSGVGFRGPNNLMSFSGSIIWVQDAECVPARRGHFGPGRLDNPCDRYHFWSLHAGGGNWLFADGSVRFLTYAAADVLPALATRAGGEAVAFPD